LDIIDLIEAPHLDLEAGPKTLFDEFHLFIMTVEKLHSS
jgi:hypothetical protein